MPPVKTLAELRRALDPKPLRLDQLDQYFVETGDARDAKVSRRHEIAERLAAGTSKKVLLAGHAGTGKSTELVKLRAEHKDRFTFVELSITTDGDPGKVNTEGLLVLIAEAVLRKTHDLRINLDEAHLEKIYGWFEQTFVSRETSSSPSGELGGGIDLQDSFLGKLLGLTATLKVGIQTGSSVVSRKVREFEHRLPELTARCGELLKEAELALSAATGTRLVLIVEDLDKVDVEPAGRLFIENPAPLAALPVRAVFTAPIFLWCNPRAGVLESHFDKVTMPMIKVANPNGKRYLPGWETVRDILAHRVDLSACIEDKALDLAIAKTAGVLRHLFSVLNLAALAAEQDFKRGYREQERINKSDVRYGLDRLKIELIQKIGVMGLPDEFKDIETPDLYHRLEELKAPKLADSDRINLLLMQAQALLEYNGKGWHRVHPLVLEHLEESRSS
ncbi:MAG: AAA family ATPase [Thermoanaerobaculia bacterium]|nr:AAA family ATPase [Thermoanaerobaculia bacterium]